MVAPDAWNAGSYREMAFGMLPVVSRLVRAVDPRAGERVLDIGCGSGTVAILAAQRGARVTGLDIAPRMLELAREDAAIAGVEVSWQEGDAQKLPFPDASFDVALSNMGLIFAPDAQAAADEMLRVLRPGGRFGITCWQQGHLMDVLHQTIERVTGDHTEALVTRWSSRAFAEERLRGRARGLLFEHGVQERPALSVAHQWAFMSRVAPPMVRALATQRPEGQARLRALYEEAAAPFVRDGLARAEYVVISGVRA